MGVVLATGLQSAAAWKQATAKRGDELLEGLPPPPTVPVLPLGAARSVQPPRGQEPRGGATEHRAQARPAHVLWGLPVQTHWGSPRAAGADLGGAARGSRQLGSWAVPPAPRALYSRSMAAPIPVAPCARARHRTPGCSRPLRPREPPRPQEQTGLGEPPGPGPSWSLPRCSCKGGLPLVPTEAASPSPPRPTLGTGLCAGEAAGEGQAAACQPVAATLNGLSSHGNISETPDPTRWGRGGLAPFLNSTLVTTELPPPPPGAQA